MPRLDVSGVPEPAGTPAPVGDDAPPEGEEV
jgi:hypothetical protein